MPTLDDGVVVQAGPLIPVPQYLSVSDADAYFMTRLDSEVWLNATSDRKQAALVTATRAIDRLNFVGFRQTDSQPLEFPRLGPLLSSNGAVFQEAPMVPAVPVDVLLACCEEAIVRLDGVDPELEMSSLRLVSTGYASLRENYNQAVPSQGLRITMGRLGNSVKFEGYLSHSGSGLK
jgi:hypothetical protein